MQTIDFGIIEDQSLESAYSYCKNIAKQKNPFLYYVSSFFRDQNKFKAFCSTYASMRILDDLIDGISNRDNLESEEKKFYLNEIEKWESQITDCHNGKKSENPILLALSDTFHIFNIPLTPWTNLAKAMRWDLEYSRFNTFDDFLHYTEGAAIAPATVFMHVLIATKSDDIYNCKNKNMDPYFYAKDLAIFCYLTHIFRDISYDLDLTENGLIYLPVDDLNEFSVSEKDLWKFKKTKTVNQNFQDLMMYQVQRARAYEKKGERLMQELFKKLDVDARFELNLLVSLYKRTMDKIERVGYNVFNGEHELNYGEIYKTTIHNARVHSFGMLKTTLLGLNLLKKAVFRKQKG